MLKQFNILTIILLLVWISFFPETLHQQYWLFTELFLGISLLILLLKRKAVKSLFSLRDWPLWLFLLGTMGAVFSAQNKGLALKTYLDISLTLFLLYHLTRQVVSSKRSIWIVIKVICLFSTAVAVFAILECAFGKNPIYENFINNPFYHRYMYGAVRRPMATQLNPVVLGTYLLGCLPLNFLLIKDKSSFFRTLALLSIILSTTVIILTLSRGVFLGLIALFLFNLIYKRNIRFLSLLLVVLITVMALCSKADMMGFGRFGFRRFIFGSYDSVLSPYRLKRLDMALNMARDYPLFGLGWNHFRIRFNEYYPQKGMMIPYEFMIADNMYLTILAETGVVGFAAFLVFIFYLLKRGTRGLALLADEKEKSVLLAAISALVALLVNMGAYELFYWHNPFALFCILIGMICALSREDYSDK